MSDLQRGNETISKICQSKIKQHFVYQPSLFARPVADADPGELLGRVLNQFLPELPFLVSSEEKELLLNIRRRQRRRP